MKSSCICPKCKGQTFYAIAEARLHDGRSLNGTTHLAVACAYMTTGETGFLGDKSARFEARVEAWVCSGCGYTELYTRDLSVLAHMATHDKASVRIVDGRPGSQGAFR